jgi:hypothetical protein
MSTGDPNAPINTNPVQEAIRLDILVDAHDKLLKKYKELEAIAEQQAISLIGLKKAIEEPASPQARRGYPHYLRLVYENLNRYIHFKTKYDPKPKNRIESETA